MRWGWRGRSANESKIAVFTAEPGGIGVAPRVLTAAGWVDMRRGSGGIRLYHLHRLVRHEPPAARQHPPTPPGGG